MLFAIAACGDSTTAVPAQFGTAGTSAATYGAENVSEDSGEERILKVAMTFLDEPPDPFQAGWLAVPTGLAETLFKRDESLNTEPCLAAGTTEAEPTAWEISLREGVKFHNGILMDAAKVKGSLVLALLQNSGWDVNHKRVERIWRREGLKVPGKQPKRGRSWLNDESCIRLRPQSPNHVWAYDFVLVRTQDGRSVRLLAVIDEYTRECLAIRTDRHIRSSDVIETLAGLMARRGVPDHIRSDNGPEFTARENRSGCGMWELRLCT